MNFLIKIQKSKIQNYFIDFPSHNSIRRLSGITMTAASIASLAKSTPSISSDLFNERPKSFTVLPNSSHDTYQPFIPPIASPYKPTLSCSSLANFTWSPTTISSQQQPTTISSALSTNLRQSFGDPSAIKPIVSALEYPLPIIPPPVKIPTYKIPSPPIKSPAIKSTITTTTTTSLLNKSENFNRNATLERYNKFIEKHKMQLELQLQQQQADFLSLSLSPPMNRRNKEMMALRGSFVSL